jgi:hypothetical protein
MEYGVVIDHNAAYFPPFLLGIGFSGGSIDEYRTTPAQYSHSIIMYDL